MMDPEDQLPGAARVSSATATTITLRTAPDTIVAGQIWVVTNPFTTNCEVRRVTGISGSTLTVASLANLPNADTAALLVPTTDCPVVWFGAIPDLSDVTTKSTNRMAFQAAVAAAKAIKGVLSLDATYSISKYLDLNEVDDLRIVGRGGATIIYPSDDSSLTGEQTPSGPISAAQERSAIVVRASARVEISGIRFQGGTSTDIDRNDGAAIYVTNSQFAKIEDCHLINHGGKLFQQDAGANDYGLRVIACSAYGARNASNPGADALVLGCRFEQPTDSDYDRSGNNGSSHGLYIFAGNVTGGRNGVRVVDCYFKNIRVTGVKVSGSTTPTRNVIIQGNIFDDCGQAFEVGADDVQEHSNIIIQGNVIIDCGTNRSGWNQGQSCRVLGARGVLIEGNEFYYTRDNTMSAAGRSAISVKRYTNSSQPVEQIRIVNNNLHALYVPNAWAARTAQAVGDAVRPHVANGCHYICEIAGATGGSEPSWSTHVGATVVDGAVTWRAHDKPGVSAPGGVLAHGMEIREVGQGSPTQGAVHIAGNQFANMAAYGLSLIRNVGLIVEGNAFNNIVIAIACQGNRIPIIRDNFYIDGGDASANVQLRLQSDSFPIVHGNVAGGRLTRTAGQNWVIDPNGGSVGADHPLLGTRGRLLPTEGKPEVVFAYGDGWQDGDIIDANGTNLLGWFSALTTLTDGAITSGTATLTRGATGTLFTALDVGMSIAVVGAGASGGLLTTTIAAVNSGTSVTLATNAATTVSGATVQYGAALNNTQAGIASGSTTLTTTSAGGTSFTANDLSKTIVVPGAGVSGADLVAGIVAILGDYRVTLSVAAGTPVNNVTARWQYGMARTNQRASIPSGHNTLTTLPEGGATFTAADVGKTVIVTGAGASGADLVTTISAYSSPTGVTLAANAGATMRNSTVYFQPAIFRAVGPFTSAATLITMLDAVLNLDAADYGSFFKTPVTTGHIRVRYATVSTASGRFYIQPSTKYATAGVVLANGTGAAPLRCNSRGEQAVGALNSRTVIWSPLAHWGAVALLQAENPAAVFHLKKNGYYPLRDPNDSGAEIVIEHLATLVEFKKITGVTIINGGTGYASPPTVIFSAPPDGSTAKGTASVAGGAVVGITITDPGTGYTTTPTISFSGGGATGATASATIDVVAEEFRWSLNG